MTGVDIFCMGFERKSLAFHRVRILLENYCFPVININFMTCLLRESLSSPGFSKGSGKVSKMSGVRLVGAVAVSTISLLALMWYVRRKKPQKSPSKKRNISENAVTKDKEGNNSLRHISSQPLIAETSKETVSNEGNIIDDKLVKEIEREIVRQEEMILKKETQLNTTKNDISLLERSGNASLQQDDLILAEVANNLNKSPTITGSNDVSERNGAYQNFNLTSGENETIISENVSVLNEAMTASRMNDVSFVNKTESESREDRVEQEIMSEQDVLSVSTMVPLLESTNLDITCSQGRDNDSNTDDVIKPETSIKLESSVCEHSQNHPSSNGNDLSHSEGKRSVLDNKSSRRNRNDSNCSSQSASHVEDRISETSSDRNSVSPSKESQHGVIENGIQSSDTSNCDSASIDSDRGSNGYPTPKVKDDKTKLSYKCNFPTELCGRLIGKFGKNINFIKEKTFANVALSTNPFTPAFQLCSIEGTQTQIDDALAMISKRFPEVDLRPVDVPSLNEPQPVVSNPLLMPELMQVIPGITQLNLPEGVSVDVVVSSIVDAGHIFMQQPTHPSFPSLERLNQFMNSCYTQDGIVPQLPRPLEVGVICAAPIMEGWYRSQVTAVYEGPDECDIKYVDYGGFSRVSGSILRQIRSDFMTLPFQGIECYMANVTPLQGKSDVYL
ncbi:AKAP1 [Mytilus edulis]|uniref:AKAP1 n=1 Tax=Mytilus edulis TaxID=6550 RepID=A0A8S3TAB0_MYTED|nr:AKAP1 [Mytilus edulis]